MLQICDVGICVEEEGESSWCWMLHATRVTTWSKYSRNMGRREEARWCLDVARNMLTTWLVMACNMLATSFAECWKHHDSQHGKRCSQHGKSCSQHQYAPQHDLTAYTFPDSNRVVANPSDASARIGRPGVAAPMEWKLVIMSMCRGPVHSWDVFELLVTSSWTVTLCLI
jgi:hypothetical protein